MTNLLHKTPPRCRIAPDVAKTSMPLPKRPSKRKCSVCKEKPVFQSMASVCSLECSIKKGILDKEKAARLAKKKENAETRARKAATKSISAHRKETQIPCNAYILERDRDLPCISCGTRNARWNAGHYIAVGAGGASPLRFDELNIFKQCVRCNMSLHGNLVEMRKGIIQRYGIERIEYLEGHHEQPHWTVEDLKAIAAHYRAKKKKLAMERP